MSSDYIGRPYWHELKDEYLETFLLWRKALQEEFTLLCDLPSLGQNARYSAHGHTTAIQRIIFEALLAEQRKASH